MRDVHLNVRLPTDMELHISSTSRPQNDARHEAKATRIHTLNRMRGQHFLAPVMADSAMDIMLSLFVGELQSSPVSTAALALANLLSREETELFLDKLVQAGLVVAIGQEPERRPVGLTPLGSARMRSFVSAYPDV